MIIRISVPFEKMYVVVVVNYHQAHYPVLVSYTPWILSLKQDVIEELKETRPRTFGKMEIDIDDLWFTDFDDQSRGLFKVRQNLYQAELYTGNDTIPKHTPIYFAADAVEIANEIASDSDGE